jgi:hypothetical protein
LTRLADFVVFGDSSSTYSRMAERSSISRDPRAMMVMKALEDLQLLK